MMNSLILKHIKNNCLKNKYIFLVLDFIQILLVFGLIYVYSYAKLTCLNREIYNGAISTYTINFDKQITFEELNDKIIDLDKLNLFLSIKLNIENTNDIDLYSYYIIENDNVHYGNKITNVNDAIYSSSIINENSPKIGDTYNVLGREYNIVGIRLDNEYIRIPFNSLIETDIIKSISLKLNFIPSQNERVQIDKKLINLFGSNIDFPESRNIILEKETSVILFVVLLFVILILINIYNLYIYIINKNKDMYKFYYVIGLSKRQIAFIVIVELLFHSLFSCAFASVLFKLTIYDIFNEISIVLLKIFDFFIPVIFFLVLNIVILILKLQLSFKSNKIH